MTSPRRVRYRPTAPVTSPEARHDGFHPGTTVLPAGHRASKRAKALPRPVVLERDAALTLRDGTTIYADIYRPQGATSVPAIVNWAPYGKGATGFHHLDRYPNRFGVPRSALSGLQSWEGNDPAYWCAHGYAVVQVDARGAFDSEGDIHALGTGEGRDGFDVVEDLAGRDWCSGKVGMAGNSYLASVQWFIAAERPPHLAAIAPWEGATDVLRHMLCRGGIPRTLFATLIAENLFGRGNVEDVLAMLTEEEPLFGPYWADKVPALDRIDVPAYVTASYTNQLHADGTVKGWARLAGPKWLRIHNTMEWPDFYEPDHVEDLRRFFDRFLKGEDNGWDATPPVRMAVLDPGHADTVDRPAEAFPPPDARPTTLHLDARTGSLSPDAVAAASAAVVDLASDEPWVDFTHTFDRTVEVFGWPMATLHVAVEGHDDADLHVYLQKLDRRGREVRHQMVDLGLPAARRWMPLLHRLGVKALGAVFFPGTEGTLRVSRRGIEPTSPPERPELSLREERPVTPGTVVEVQVPLWPIGMRWHRGETLRMRVAARSLLPPPDPSLPVEPMQPGTRHLLHTGGGAQATLTLAIAPAR